MSLELERALSSTWGEDARKAITENPDYFVWWYSVKSMALVAALAGLAYYVGRDSRPRASGLGGAGCPSCGGVSHPASGSVLPSGKVVCGPCVRRFWGWAGEHGKKSYRVGPKGKGSKYIPFPTGIVK